MALETALDVTSKKLEDLNRLFQHYILCRLEVPIRNRHSTDTVYE